MHSPSQPPFPDPQTGLDATVRAQLEAEAARINGQAMWQSLVARLEADPPPGVSTRPPYPPSRRRLWQTAAAVALAVGLLAVLFYWPVSTIIASPTEVVRKSRTAHTSGPDRCYTQTLDFAADASDRIPLLAKHDWAARIWSRGDRFVAEQDRPRSGAWGNDTAGGVWFAPSPRAAARFRLSELPKSVQQAVILRGMAVPTILSDLLNEHQLSWSHRPARTRDVYQISTTILTKPQPLQIIAADLTIDRNTHTLRQLILKRQLPRGNIVTLTFQLSATATHSENYYTPEAHLEPDAPIHDQNHPVLRRKIMLESLGDLFNH